MGVLLVLGAIALLFVGRGRAFAPGRGDALAAVVGLAGALALAEGRSYGLIALVPAGLWFWQARGVLARRGIPPTEARALLGLSAGADAAAIRVAHRRLIARSHPDQGGSTELAARINTARDVLLADLPRPAARA